jgi:hypothetical protein
MAEDTPGTYRVDDHSAVTMDDAKAAWTPFAREALEQVARTYNGVINYGEIAEAVQAGSGIRTRMLTHYWVGDVLGAISVGCRDRGEPLLSSLCVRQDGTIGDGYGADLVELGRPAPADLELAAAEERLECYRHFGATLPADGGRPTFTPTVAKKRSAATRKAWDERVRPVCPQCGIVMPASKICDQCDDR